MIIKMYDKKYFVIMIFFGMIDLIIIHMGIIGSLEPIATIISLILPSVFVGATITIIRENKKIRLKENKD